MHKKHLKIFNKLEQIAKKSTMRCKHAAAIVSNKGTILSTGFNYILPKNKRKGYFSVHAERSALINCNIHKLKGSSLYVIRLGYDNKFKLSQPCKMCQSLIKTFIQKYNLNKKVYYSI